MEFELIHVWEQMGLVARLVVGLLLVMSVIALGVAIERFRTLREGRASSARYAAALQSHIDAGDIDAAAKLRAEGSPLGRVVGAGLEQYVRTRAKAPDRERAVASAEAALERTIVAEGTELRRGLGALATIGSTAPFVGLFGTVVGIINSFAEIARTGSGGMETVSGGIAEALVATALGILVAVPAVVLFNYFSSKVEAVEATLATGASAALDAMRRDGWSKPEENENE
jgi:biopolymer transport protein ExbB/TolQ